MGGGPFTVLVTGMGPFPDPGHGGQYEHNSSHLVTAHMPDTFPASHRLNPTGHDMVILRPTCGPGAYCRSSYGYIRRFVSELHARHRADVDLFLHLGMADGWPHVSVERAAFKQGFSASWAPFESSRTPGQGYYLFPDNDGKVVSDCGPCPWHAMPSGLGTRVDVDRAAAEASERLSQVAGEESSAGISGTKEHRPLQVKTHDDAGPYCCGFIFYESLATRYTKGTKGDVMFCHIPGEWDIASLEKARDALLAIIGAAAAQMLKH